MATSNDGVRTEFGSDTFGRPASQTWRVGGIDYQLASSRNALGQVETLWYPANPRYRYTPSGPVPILGTGCAAHQLMSA